MDLMRDLLGLKIKDVGKKQDRDEHFKPHVPIICFLFPVISLTSVTMLN